MGTTMLFILFILCQTESVCLALGICAVFTLLFILYLFNKSKFRTFILPTVFLSVIVSCFLFVSAELFVRVPYRAVSGTETKAVFTLSEYPSYDGGRYYCMSEYKDEAGKTYKVRLSLPAVPETDYTYENEITSAEPGDELLFKAFLYTPGGNNEDISRSYNSKGVYLGAYPLGDVSFEKQEKVRWDYFLKREKQRTINLLLSEFDRETASIGISLLTGNKNLMDNGSYEAVRSAGVSHLLAVSGLHLSVWIMLVMRLVEGTGMNKRKWALLLLVFDFLVMFFASFSGSVLRAGFMTAVYLFGIALKENSDSLNSLGLSAVLILLCNPYSAVNVSFLLSFVASFSIIVIAVPLIERTEKKTEKYLFKRPCLRLLNLILSAAVISVVVTVYTLPIMISYFGTVSTVSVITNILLIPVSTPVIVAFGLYVMLWFVPVISLMLQTAAFLFSEYLLFCVRLMSAYEYSVVSFDKGSLAVSFVLSTLMLSAPFLYEYASEKKRIKKAFSGK